MKRRQSCLSLLALAFLVAMGLYGTVFAVDSNQLPNVPGSSILTPIYTFLMSLNPFILIILGLVVFFVGKLAKFVGIILIILGVIHLLLPYLSQVI